MNDINTGLNELKDKKILVIGLGKSGISVLKKLSGICATVVAADSNPLLKIESQFKFIKKHKDFRLEIKLDEKANENTMLLDGIDLVITSPGIAQDIMLLQYADSNGIPVISELEFAWRLLDESEKKNTIAVTGTNGKTTVVTLIRQMLADSGRNAVVCGNIGNPLTNAAGPGHPEGTIRIIEVSSFQLERTIHFNPFAGIILNITSDHMDRHYFMDNYAQIKFRLFSNSTAGQWGIFNSDDRYINENLKKRNYYADQGFSVIRCSLSGDSTELYHRDGRIFYNIGKNTEGSIDVSGIKLTGNHNISNIMASVAAVKIFGVEDAFISQTLENFNTLEHRIEFVAEVEGIRIFNDSKATNPDATIKALRSFKKEVTLILGGKDKGMDFNEMIPAMEETVENVVLIGETGPKIAACLKEYPYNNSLMPFRVFRCDSFKEAISRCFEVTGRGKVILLSPACASFDMFNDYKDRGKKFKELVLERMRTGGFGG